MCNDDRSADRQFWQQPIQLDTTLRASKPIFKYLIRCPVSGAACQNDLGIVTQLVGIAIFFSDIGYEPR